MAGLFGPTVAEIQQSIAEKGRAQDVHHAGGGIRGAFAQAGRMLGQGVGQLAGGGGGDPALQKAQKMQEIEQRVRQSGLKVGTPEFFDFVQTEFQSAGMTQEALAVYQMRQKAQLEAAQLGKAEADAASAGVESRIKTASEGDATRAAQSADEEVAARIAASEASTAASRDSLQTAAINRQAKQLEMQKTKLEIKSLSEAADSPLASMQEQLKGLPDKLKMVAIMARAETDPRIKSLLGGDEGVYYLSKMVQNMAADDPMSVAAQKFELARRAHGIGEPLGPEEQKLFEWLDEKDDALTQALKVLTGGGVSAPGGTKRRFGVVK